MLQVLHDGRKFFAKLSIDQKKTVQDAGFIFCPIEKKWVTSDPRVAYRLWENLEDKSKQKVMNDLDLLNDNIIQGITTSAASMIPFTHQFHATRWVLSRKNSYLAMEAGTGKTAILPLCINSNPGKAIVVCPSFLKTNWKKELEQWLIDKKEIQIINNKSTELNPQTDIYILPSSLIHVYPLRQKFFKLGIKFKYLFIDEAHQFKSETAKRTVSLVGGKFRIKGQRKLEMLKGFHTIAEHTVCLSGTPMPNGRPMELYPILSKQAPHALNYLDKFRYGIKFCAGFQSEWGWDFSGSSNEDELNKILTRNYMMIKKLDECVDLPEKLPPKFLYLKDEGKKLEAETMRLLRNVSLDQIIAMESERNAQFKEKVQERKKEAARSGISTASGFAFLSELRKLLGLAKVDEVAQIMEDMLEYENKFILFCWHTEVVEKIAAKLSHYNPVTIVGSTRNTQRDKYVEMFQKDDNAKLMIANIQAAGVGLTLTKSFRVGFLEPSYVASQNNQAIARSRRIGQTRPVQAYYFVRPNSLDHLILNAHQRKEETEKKIIW